MYFPPVFSYKTSLWEKSLIFFVLASYLQVCIYTINLVAPDVNTSFLNSVRLFFVLILIRDSLKLPCLFRPYPILILSLLLMSFFYILLFSFNSPLRLVSGLISFLPLILLVTCLAQSRVNDSINKRNFKWLNFHVRALLYIALIYCFVNEYLWKIGLMPNKFGGALSFYGLLPRNTSFYSIPGTSGNFVFACLALLCYFSFLISPSQSRYLFIDFFSGLIIILAGSSGAAFVSLVVLVLFYFPCLVFRTSLNKSASYSLINAIGRLSLLFIPVSLISIVLRRDDALTSLSGRFSILDYFSDQLGGITLLPNPDFFGLATNYAQSAFGDSYFVQTPDTVIISLLVQYGSILTGLILLCLTLPFILLGLKSLSSLYSLRTTKLSAKSLLGISMLLGSLPFMITSNILESYPLIFFIAFLYSSPLIFASRTKATYW